MASDIKRSSHNTGAGPGEPAARPGWRRWFALRDDWHFRGSLVPAGLGYKMLDVYAWATGLMLALAGLLVYLQNSAHLRRNPFYWVFVATAVPPIGAAVLRGLPFRLRYALVAVSLLVALFLAAASVGIGPNFILSVLLFLSLTGMCFGFRAGLLGLAAILVIFTLIAVGWVQGAMPLYLPDTVAASILDLRSARMWLRVGLVMTIGMAALLLLMRYVLQDLNHALRQSTAALHRVALEQEQRARAAAALSASEETFSRVFRFSPDAISVADYETGRYIDVNEGFERLFGYRRDELIGRTAAEIGHWARPEDRAQLLALLREHGSVRDFQAQGRRRDGIVRTFQVSAEVVEIAGRQALVVAGHDITDRLKSEQALRESEEKFSLAFRSGPDAMAIAELETGRYLEVNEGFERLWGHARAEVVGRTSMELGLWRDTASRETFLAAMRDQGAVRGLECIGVNRRGEAITYLMSAEWITLGGTRCILSVAHDITGRKLAAERERQVREDFTRRLITTQEAERHRIAKELHDSLGQNLLLIKNRAQLALARPDSPAELGAQVESIVGLAAQAIAEVRQISHDLRPYQLDQLGLTRALQAMIDVAAQSTAIRFQCRLEPVDEVFSATDAIEVYRVVQESLNNIMKHSGARQVEITLERDVHQVRLWIADDGRGFAARGPAGEGPAAGFGLQNLAERVGMLGGQLAIDSTPGAGTRIEVTVAIAGRR